MPRGVVASANRAFAAAAVFASRLWADSMQDTQERKASGWPFGPFAPFTRPGIASDNRR